MDEQEMESWLVEYEGVAEEFVAAWCRSRSVAGVAEWLTQVLRDWGWLDAPAVVDVGLARRWADALLDEGVRLVPLPDYLSILDLTEPSEN